MEKFNIRELDDRDKPGYILQLKHGTLQNAARKMGMDKFRLSRIVNGAPHTLEDHVLILQYMGILEGVDFTMPRMDMETFLKLNQEAISAKLKREIILYNPEAIKKKKDTRKAPENLNWPHQQSEMFPELSIFNTAVKNNFNIKKKPGSDPGLR